MIERRYLKAIVGIVAIFAVGLVFFFLFSAAYGDGLERTMEEAGVEEHDPVYQAPFSYGDDYLTALLAGILGFGLTFGVVFAYFKIAGKGKGERKEAR